MSVLRLAVKRQYFDEIKAGIKMTQKQLWVQSRALKAASTRERFALCGTST